MKRYKDFIHSLNEILTPEQEHEVNTTYPEREPWIQNHLDNHLFSKGVDDIYEPLGSSEKTHTHKKIEDLLNKTLSARNPNHIPIEISKEDYKKGNYQHFVPRNPEFPESKDKYQPRSIASAIGDNFPYQLEKDYMADPSRQAKGETDLSVRITRSKTGIAGQTSGGQSWKNRSCKNYVSGCNRKYLKPEYQHGTVVAYLHNKNGIEIARKTFHPYYDKDGNVMYKENSHYGVRNQEFDDKAREIEQRLSPPAKNANLYYLDNSNHYDNIAYEKGIEYRGSKLGYLHPNLSAEVLHNIYDTETKKPNTPNIILSLARHTNVDKKLLDKLMKDKNPYVRHAVLLSRKSDEDHANLGLYDTNRMVRDVAAQHKNLSPEIINKALTSSKTDYLTKSTLLQHKNLSQESIDRILNSDKAEDIGFLKDIVKHPKIKPHQVEIAFNKSDNKWDKEEILNSSKTPAKLLHNILLNDKTFSHIAAKHKNLPQSDLDHIFDPRNTTSENIKINALDNPNIQTSHLESAFSQINEDVFKHKIFHHELAPKSIKNNVINQVKYDAHNVNYTPENIRTIINSPELSTYDKRYAVREGNIYDEDLDKIFDKNHPELHNLIRDAYFNPKIKGHHIENLMSLYSVPKDIKKLAFYNKNCPLHIRHDLDNRVLYDRNFDVGKLSPKEFNSIKQNTLRTIFQKPSDIVSSEKYYIPSSNRQNHLELLKHKKLPSDILNDILSKHSMFDFEKMSAILDNPNITLGHISSLLKRFQWVVNNKELYPYPELDEVIKKAESIRDKFLTKKVDPVTKKVDPEDFEYLDRVPNKKLQYKIRGIKEDEAI